MDCEEMPPSPRRAFRLRNQAAPLKLKRFGAIVWSGLCIPPEKSGGSVEAFSLAVGDKAPIDIPPEKSGGSVEAGWRGASRRWPRGTFRLRNQAAPLKPVEGEHIRWNGDSFRLRNQAAPLKLAAR